jgi:hypothetical protein
VSHRLSGALGVCPLRFAAAVLSLPRGIASRGSSDFFDMKKLLLDFVTAGAALAGMVGCAQIKKPAAQPKAAAVGSQFDQSGWVSLYAGEPCTPQIMFDFHGTRSTAWLAAARRETDILTEAANKDQRVHVLGKWRRGAQSRCNYVQVMGAELTR